MRGRTRKMLALVVALTYLLSLMVVSPVMAGGNMKVTVNFNLKFKDGEQAKWAFKNISELSAKAVIQGYQDGSFRPNKPVTRAEALVMILKAAGVADEAQPTVTDATYLPFKDAANLPAWAKGYIATAVQKGFLAEDKSLNFQANKPATRAWVARLLVRAFDLTKEVQTKVDAELPFVDEAAITADVAAYVAVAVENSIIQGYPDGTFKPNKPVTRAEMAALLGNADNELEFDKEDCKVVGTIKTITLDEPTTETTTTDETTTDDTATANEDNAAVQMLSTDGAATEEATEDEATEVDEDVVEDEAVEEDDDEAVEEDDYAAEDTEENVVETVGTIALTTKDAKEVSYGIAKDVQVFINDEAAALADLEAGDFVEVALADGVIKFIEVKPLMIRGKLVVANTVYKSLTVKTKDGTEETYPVSDQVQIKLNGKTGQLSDLKEGAKVVLMVDDGKITFIKAHKLNMKGKVKEQVKVKIKEEANEKAKDRLKDKAEGKGRDAGTDEDDAEAGTVSEIEIEVNIQG